MSCAHKVRYDRNTVSRDTSFVEVHINWVQIVQVVKQSKLPDKQSKALKVAWSVGTRLSTSRLKPILQSVAQQVETQYCKHDCQTRVGCQMGRYQ